MVIPRPEVSYLHGCRQLIFLPGKQTKQSISYDMVKVVKIIRMFYEYWEAMYFFRSTYCIYLDFSSLKTKNIKIYEYKNIYFAWAANDD